MKLIQPNYNGVKILRKIRILKTIPVVATEGHFKNNREMTEQIKGPHTEVVYRDLPECGVKAVYDDRTRKLVTPFHIRQVLAAEKEGFDAIAMGCLLEPGVKEAKEKCKIPVVGSLEASVYLAAMLGNKFSFIISGSDKIVGEEIPKSSESHILIKLVRSYGLLSRLASIRGIGLEVLDFKPEDKNLEKLKELMLNESRRAIDEDGANVIISYDGIKVLRYLQQRLPVPVISPRQAQIMLAEVLVNSQLAKQKL